MTSFFTHGFLVCLWENYQIFLVWAFFVHFNPQHGFVSPPSPAATGLALQKPRLLSAALALLRCQITPWTMPLTALLWDFLKVLPKPELTIPAETSRHWLQRDNYTLCRKHWWVNPRKRLPIQAVTSHIVDSFWMFWPAVTRDDCVVCCLARYSNFVSHFLPCNSSRFVFWFHLPGFMPSLQLLKPLTVLLLFSKRSSVPCLHDVIHKLWTHKPFLHPSR